MRGFSAETRSKVFPSESERERTRETIEREREREREREQRGQSVVGEIEKAVWIIRNFVCKVRLNVCESACVLVRPFIFMHVPVCAFTYTRTHTYTRTRTNTYTHTGDHSIC